MADDRTGLDPSTWDPAFDAVGSEAPQSHFRERASARPRGNFGAKRRRAYPSSSMAVGFRVRQNAGAGARLCS